MPHRRARDSASSSTRPPSESSGSSSAGSTAPRPPPGVFSQAWQGQQAQERRAASKQEEEDKKQPQTDLYKKTKICKFNDMGICTRGRNCRFAHGEVDKVPLPDLSRTKLCKEFFSTGQCSQAADCTFAHAKEELRRHRHLVRQGDKDSAAPQKPRGAAAAVAAVVPEAALGQEVAQLQANANLLCSDLVYVLSKMREKQAELQLLSHPQARPAAMPSYGATAVGGVGGDAPRVPHQDLDSLLGVFGKEGALAEPRVVRGGGGGPLSSWPGSSGGGSAGSSWPAGSVHPSQSGHAARIPDAARREEPPPRPLSPMYAPSLRLDDYPLSFAL